jgi:hypothetical protein
MGSEPKLPATFTPAHLRPRHDGWTPSATSAFIPIRRRQNIAR